MDLSPIQPFLDWLASHQQWVALSIVAIAFLESLAIAGIVIPGVLLLFGACAMAGSGILGVWTTLGCALMGAILGDGVSFFLGKTLKDHIRDLWPFRKYPQWLDNGEAFFHRHGGKSIIIGRFVGPIRPVLPLVAGMLNMPSLRFVGINFLSALGWAPLYVLPGYLFGLSLQQGISLPEGLSNLGLVLLGIIAIAFIVIRLTHWHLHPDSRLYKAAHAWIDRQHNVRLFWHWLAERRGHQTTYPLISMALLVFSTLLFVVLWLLNSNTAFFDYWNHYTQAYFAGIRHPWLDQLFMLSAKLGEANCLRGFTVIFVVWLLLKRHFAAATHVAAAVVAGELLGAGLQSASGSGFPGTATAGISLVSGLMASFVAQEVSHQYRWWAYTCALLPILLVSISMLYLGQLTLSSTLGGIFLGSAICGATRVSFSRYNTRAIHADPGFWLCSLVSLLFIGLYLAVTS